MKKALTALITAAICTSGLVLLQLPRLQSHPAQTELSSDNSSPLEDDPETIKAIAEQAEALQLDRLKIWHGLPNLGFDNLVADWAFLGFLQYFGNAEERNLTGYAASPEFFQVIIEHDPYFRLPYRFLSSSVTLFAGQPQETIRLLEQGLAKVKPTFPADSFWLWRYKAVDELLFLGDIQAAINSFEKSAEWAAQSPAKDADRYVTTAQRSANFLRQNPDSREVQANSWMMIWANAINENVRQFVESQIEALGYQVSREGSSLQLQDRLPPAEEEASSTPSPTSASDPIDEGIPSPIPADTSPLPPTDPSAIDEPALSDETINQPTAPSENTLPAEDVTPLQNSEGDASL